MTRLTTALTLLVGLASAATQAAAREPEEIGSLGAAINEMLERLGRARTALRTSEKQYRDLFDNLRVGVGVVTLEGNFLGANKAFQEMLGYSLDELKEKDFREITPERWEKSEDAHVQQILERGYSDLYEKEYIRKDGTVFPVELRSYLQTDLDGKPVGMIVIAIRKDHGTKTDFVFNPLADTKMDAGDHIIVLGTAEQVGRLQDYVG